MSNSFKKYPIILRSKDIAYGSISHTLISDEEEYISWCSINGNSGWIEGYKEIPWAYFSDEHNSVEKPINQLFEYLLEDLSLWGNDSDALFEFMYDNTHLSRLSYNVPGAAITMFNRTIKAKELGCMHPKKYKNHLSKSLSFWVCPECKADLGNA